MHTGTHTHRACDVLTVMNVVLIKWSLDVVWTPPREDIERNWIGCVVWHSGAAQVQCRKTTTCFPLKR